METQWQSVYINTLVLCSVLLMTQAFLLDDACSDAESTTSCADLLNSQLQAVTSENEQLKTRLEAAEASVSKLSMSLDDLKLRTDSDLVRFEGDWVLVFRATKGIGRPVYDAWTDVGHHDDDPLTRAKMPCGCTTVNGSLPCDRHYRSRLLNTWPSNSIGKVRLAVYENGVEKENVTFNGTGSDYMSWFSPSRVLQSSWVDFPPAASFSHFSIKGDEVKGRHFFINHVYGGCPGDVGWLVVKDTTRDSCHWGSVQHVPTILYSPGHRQFMWEGPHKREADVMAVFVKFRAPDDDRTCP